MFQKDSFPTDEESDSEKKNSEGENVMENCELFQEELIKQPKRCDSSAKRDDSIAWKTDSEKKKKWKEQLGISSDIQSINKGNI